MICPRHRAFSVASDPVLLNSLVWWPARITRVVEVWIADISAEVVRCLSLPERMDAAVYFMSGPGINLWPSCDQSGPNWKDWHQSQFRKAWNATKKNAPKTVWCCTWFTPLPASRRVKGICLTWDPGMANCSLSSTEASTWQKATPCGNSFKEGKWSWELFWWVAKRRPSNSHDVLQVTRRCRLNYWGCFFGMFLFNSNNLSFKRFWKGFPPASKPEPSGATLNKLIKAMHNFNSYNSSRQANQASLSQRTQWRSKWNPNPLATDLHNFCDFFMSIGWAWFRLDPVLRWHKLGGTLMRVQARTIHQ